MKVRIQHKCRICGGTYDPQARYEKFCPRCGRLEDYTETKLEWISAECWWAPWRGVWVDMTASNEIRELERLLLL